MGTEHLEWGVEGVKTQKTGILHAFNAGTKEWCVLVDGGERLIFTADVCQSINGDNGETVFNSLLKGDEISYVLEYGEIKDVALVSHMDTEVLVPKTETAVAGILDSADSKEVIVDSPECSLEDEAFRVDSTGWKELILEDFKGGLFTIKANQGKDICELPNGVQLFTPAAMARELILSGRVQDKMTGEQAQWLLKNTPNNIPEGCEFAGFINSKDGKLHFNGETACYWIGESDEKGNPKALFCIDINKVDEEMRPYTDEMIISDYDMESMMQVRLLKKKTV